MALPSRLLLALLLLGLARALLRQRPAPRTAPDESTGCQTQTLNEDDNEPYLLRLLSLLTVPQYFLLPQTSTHYLRVGDGTYAVQRISFATPAVALSAEDYHSDYDDDYGYYDDASDGDDDNKSGTDEPKEGLVVASGDDSFRNFGLAVLFSQLMDVLDRESPTLRFVSFANTPLPAEPALAAGSSSAEGERETSEEGLMSWIPKVLRSLVTPQDDPARSRPAALETGKPIE